MRHTTLSDFVYTKIIRLWIDSSCCAVLGCASHASNPGWHVFLYNLTADRAETTDLWATQREDAKAMLGRFIAWQASVDHSKGADEIGKGARLSRSEALHSSESLSENLAGRLPHRARRGGRCWPRITMKSRVGSASASRSRAPPCFVVWRTVHGIDTGLD